MRRITITPELLQELAARYAPPAREEQRFAAEDALRMAVAVGEQMCPHFAIDTYNETAYLNIARWLVGDPAMVAETTDGKECRGSLGKGIYLQGGVGVGKTLCIDIFAIVAKYLQLGAWDTYRTDTVCGEFCRTGSVDEITQRASVCFQDLGSEPAEVLYMGNRRNVMRSVLEQRGDMRRVTTLITSNIPIGKVGGYYGSRVQSRLVEMCNVLTIGGSDRRR